MRDDVKLTGRPLVVCDIDEVVLEFLTPFDRFLQSRGYQLLPRSFRLHGNIVSVETGEEAPHELVDLYQESFFADQALWQTPALDAVTSLHGLSSQADIVFLTAMPPRHHAVRRTLLNTHGLHFPMIATEDPKGEILAALHGNRDVPIVFIDDIAYNLESVRKHIPEAQLVHLMANDDFRKLAPEPGDHVAKATDWNHAVDLIVAHISR